MEKASSRRAALWSLYDFANSLAAAVFGIYFSQWLVVDHHVSDFKFNLIFVGSSFLLLLTAPIFGVIVDKVRVKMPSLWMVTAYSFVSLLLVGIIAQFAPPTLLVLNVVVALLTAGQYFYQLAYVFYNPLLKELGDDTEQAKYSGYGAAAGGVGQIFGLLITLPLATGAIYFFGHHDESQVFIPTAFLFLAFALPMLLFFKERSKPPAAVDINIKQEMGNIITKFKELKKYPGVHRYLFATFLFSDAVLTAGHNLPIYVQQLFQIDEQTKIVVLGSVLVVGALGAWVSGWFAKRMGEKRLLLVLMIGWIILLPIAALQRHLGPFIVCMVLLGILLGATGAVSRAVMSYLTPAKEAVHVFSYYSMTGRLASFLGPFSWGLITYAFAGQGLLRYQVALGAMTLFILWGYVVTLKIPSENQITA